MASLREALEQNRPWLANSSSESNFDSEFSSHDLSFATNVQNDQVQVLPNASQSRQPSSIRRSLQIFEEQTGQNEQQQETNEHFDETVNQLNQNAHPIRIVRTLTHTFNPNID